MLLRVKSIYVNIFKYNYIYIYIMIDKIYYSIASMSFLFICFRECYNYFNKKEDYIRVNTLESDMDLNYTEYIESSDGVNMDYNEYKKNNIVKQSKILIDLK